MTRVIYGEETNEMTWKDIVKDRNVHRNFTLGKSSDIDSISTFNFSTDLNIPHTFYIVASSYNPHISDAKFGTL